MNKITMSGVGETGTAMREFEKIGDAVWPVTLPTGDGGVGDSGVGDSGVGIGAAYLSTRSLLAFVLPADNFCKQ